MSPLYCHDLSSMTKLFLSHVPSRITRDHVCHHLDSNYYNYVFKLLTNFRGEFHLRQKCKVGLVSTLLETLNLTDEIVAIPFAASINEQFATILK
jgi:hypothetical protein